MCLLKRTVALVHHYTTVQPEEDVIFLNPNTATSKETQLSRTLLFDRGPAKWQQKSPLQGGRTPGAITSHNVIDLITKPESKPEWWLQT